MNTWLIVNAVSGRYISAYRMAETYTNTYHRAKQYNSYAEALKECGACDTVCPHPLNDEEPVGGDK